MAALDITKKLDVNFWELALDKLIDFVLIFVGLYAAMAVERCQAAEGEREEYVGMLGDFSSELTANLAQEASIEKDLGPIDQTDPNDNLGPMSKTFEEFFKDLEHDETLVDCLRKQFLRTKHKVDAAHDAECHAAYAVFHKERKQAKASGKSAAGFGFKPAVLTPFYRYEVWDMYLAGGVKLFKNKELALHIGEIYSNAKLIERQVADIEKTYNDVFMSQSGRTAATDAELAEIIEDEEEDGELSAEDRKALLDVDESLKDERYEVVELRSVLALKVERLKQTVITMRGEIRDVKEAIGAELAKVGK